jgi:arogenate dehydrogenase (NADP+)
MKIGIVGLGLIGGSLALDLTARGHYLVGVSRSDMTCEKAVRRDIVKEAGASFALVEGCELIFICTPIEFIIPTLSQLVPYLSPHTVVTDVGSVKGSIVNQGKHLWSNFVGSHPMAGTANQGIDAVEENLFLQAPCIITPDDQTPASAIALIEKIWSSVGCEVITTTPETHDQAVAWISHLPVMVSANLINSCLGEKDEQIKKIAQKIASSGFRDTSRVGGGNPELGLMMVRNNQENLLHSLKQYQQNLELLINNIEQEQWQEITNLLITAQNHRPKYL